MFCKNCGANLEEGMSFCGNCGMKVPQEPQQTAEQYYHQPEENARPAQDEYPSYEHFAEDTQSDCNAPSGSAYTAEPVPAASSLNPTLWIVLNAVMIVVGCCCSIQGILGIVGLVFAIQGNNAFTAGDTVTASNKLKTAKILFFVAIGLWVVSFIFSLATGLFASLMDIGGVIPERYY